MNIYDQFKKKMELLPAKQKTIRPFRTCAWNTDCYNIYVSYIWRFSYFCKYLFFSQSNFMVDL